MFEKVNPHHPDKVADRVAGAIVDAAYTNAEGGWTESNPRIAVEVLIGHSNAIVIIETSLTRGELNAQQVSDILCRLCPEVPISNQRIIITAQDQHLSDNQSKGLHVGDNGIFKGMPVTDEQRDLVKLARKLTEKYKSDGKYILDGDDYIICQSNMPTADAEKLQADIEQEDKFATINPLGEWTGGTGVDCGCTNRKLGSDMGDAVTGGGLHGKDLSKADVSVNILCYIKAQAAGQRVEACTAIGDGGVTFCYEDGREVTMTFDEVVEQARMFILTQYGSFEKFAEWGLIS